MTEVVDAALYGVCLDCRGAAGRRSAGRGRGGRPPSGEAVLSDFKAPGTRGRTYVDDLRCVRDAALCIAQTGCQGHCLTESFGCWTWVDGFLGCSIHASEDRTTVVNYAQWRDADAFRAMFTDPDIRVHAAGVREVATVQPVRYCVDHVATHVAGGV